MGFEPMMTRLSNAPCTSSLCFCSGLLSRTGFLHLLYPDLVRVLVNDFDDVLLVLDACYVGLLEHAGEIALLDFEPFLERIPLSDEFDVAVRDLGNRRIERVLFKELGLLCPSFHKCRSFLD